ncbi:MAG: NAD+ synthase, partial [Burkholderiaceae bacterium]|nr:NAD+ synthase [Burkholderiaceae bacterium]
MTGAAPLRIALAQLDFLVGDVRGNVARVIDAARAARAQQVDLVVFPELALSGYPPEDLLFHRGLRRQIEAGLAEVCRGVGDVAVLVGLPEYSGSQIYNASALVARGAVQAMHRKSALPNYQVFDEKRYFSAGAQPTVVDVRGVRVGVLVCEDIWEREAAQLSQSAGAELLIVSNASPYQLNKQRDREAIARARVNDVGLPLAYVNLVGGQDELVFDGQSFVMDEKGVITMRAPAYAEGLHVVDFARDARGRVVPCAGEVAPELPEVASVYGALVLGVRDYVGK